MTMFRTWARHISAAVMGLIGTWLVNFLIDVGFPAAEAQETVTELETLITTAVLIGLYAIFEKGLKPIWYNVLGERQTEDKETA